MNIHEYQAKSLLKKYGVPVPNGKVINSLRDLIGLDQELSGSKFVVKSQIHAGGRGASVGASSGDEPADWAKKSDVTDPGGAGAKLVVITMI